LRPYGDVPTPEDPREPVSPHVHGSPPPWQPGTRPDSATPESSGQVPRGEVTAALGAIIGGALVTLAVLFGRGGAPDEAMVPHVDAAGIMPSKAHVVPSAPGRWSNGSHSRWKSDRPKDLVLELPADNKVPVWMKSVRPMLVVRCMNKSTEVFVFTESAAQIETQDENHAVQIGFDGEPPSTERWPDSVEHDALFAPNGQAFARRLLNARTMNFAFSPHNAQPVQARFNVSGLRPLIEPAAKRCGWQ
jgi:hypothetical protein